MIKKVTTTSRFTPSIYIEKTNGTIEYPSGENFTLHHGEKATITMSEGELFGRYEEIYYARLCFDTVACLGDPWLEFDSNYLTGWEISEDPAMFRIDALGDASVIHPRSITLDFHGMNDTSASWTFTMPYVEVQHEVIYSYHKTRSFPIAKNTEATLHIPSGTVSLAIRDIEDPVLGFSLHHYTTTEPKPCWHTNLDQTLSTNGALYTDPQGFQHFLKESFYSLDETGKKKKCNVPRESVTADANGRLWYNGEEVFRDLRTPHGLRASSRLYGVNNAEWVEERYEEERQAAEQLKSLKTYLFSFVKVNTKTKTISQRVTERTLRTGDTFESFYDNTDTLFSSEEEALQFCSILTQLEEDLTPEDKTAYQKQKDLFLEHSKEYNEEISARYVDYTVAKATFERLSESFPVSFLFSENGETGYNKSGALVTVHAEGSRPLMVVRERFDDTNKRRVTMIHDGEGHVMRFYYGTNNLLSRVVNSLGEEVDFTYTGTQLTSITPPHAPTLTFTYTDGHVATVKDGYTVSRFLYNGEHRLCDFLRTTTVDTVTHGSVEMGEALSLSSFTIVYEQDSFTVFDRLKNRQEIYYVDGYLVTETYVIENDKVVYAEECVLDNVSKLVTKRSVASPACLGIYPLEDFCPTYSTVEEYTYSDFYECTVVIRTHYSPNGEEKEWLDTYTDYNEKGNPFSVLTAHTILETETSPEHCEDIQTNLVYNDDGKLIKTESFTVGKKHQLGCDIEEITYDGNGNETVRVSYNSLLPSDKLYTEKSYDAQGRVKAELDETGRFETRYSYDGDTQRLQTVRECNGKNLSYAQAYAANDKTESITSSTEDGEGNTESVYYTAGLPVCVTNGRHVFNYAYDGKGRVVNVHLDGWDYLGKTYTENEDGTETVTTTHAGFDTAPLSVTADKFGELKRSYIPGVKDVTYTYTPDGRTTSETDAVSGNQKNYSYDAKQRLKRCTSFDGILTTYSYDEEDRIIEKYETFHSPFASTFEYDPDTKQISHMTVDEFSVFPAYDAMGRKTKRTVWKNGCFLHEENVTYAKYGDHATLRPSTVELSSATDTMRLKYVYDAMGNIEGIYENGILSTRYEYDALGRLTREDNRAFESTNLWEYDKSGNILSRRTYTFTAKPTEELLTEAPTDALIYGYAGDHLMSLNGEHLFHYSAEGHPDTYRGMPATWHAPRMLATLGDAYFSYNADGLCTSFNGRPHFYSADGRLIYDTVLQYFYDESGSLLGFSDGLSGPRYLYRRDALGNIIAILDNTGNIVVKYKYNAWGECKVLNPDGTENTSSGFLGNKNPYRYRGYYYSTDLGLYYLKSRFYDPEIGRFICADSLEYLDPHTVGGLNLYAYCGNNPVMNVDPTGHAWWKKITNFISNFFSKVAEGVAQAVNKIVSSVGAVVSTGQEIPVDVTPVVPGIVTQETGTGYNKNFGNGKPVNIYIEGENLINASVGIDVNVGGYGISMGAGLLSMSAGIHAGKSSFDWSMTAPNKLSFKHAYAVKDGYAYRKTTIDFWVVIAAIMACYGVPLLSGGQPIATTGY